MNKKNSIKTLVVIGFLLISTIGLIIPNTTALPVIDEDDGIWTDDFNYDNQTEVDANLIYKNCTVDYGYVSLNKSMKGLVYDFDSGDHNAYKYQSFFFIPRLIIFSPSLHVLFESRFHSAFELPNIKEYELSGDEDEIYAITSSAGLNRYVVHRFKFELDNDAEKLGNLTVSWFGKGKDVDSLTLYYWTYLRENKLLGYWKYLDDNTTSDEDIILNQTLSEEELELALTDDGVFNICVVATSNSLPFTLMTNYVNVTSLNLDSYKTDTATIETKNPIKPGIDNFYWEILTWNDYERGDATVKYQVYRNTSEEDILIEDTYINGNSEGLTDPPINLYLVNSSSYDKLKIKATLDTDDPSVSPRIFSWTVTWQKETNKWQDNFNSTHRIAVKTRIKIEDNLSINPISGDWPMFGQNPQNTRTSEGKGPSDQNSTDIYWWDKTQEDPGLGVSDPVISDEYLYLCSRDGKLFRYDFVLDPESQYGGKLPSYKVDDFNEFNADNKDIVAPPAITNEYIVIVTGETDNGGTENFVYVLKKDYNSSISFDYGDNICYWSPPIVSDDKIFVTTWSGDPDLLQSNENNKIIALNIDIEGLTKEWEFDLPFHSFSAPAVSDEFVVVGCTEKSEDNLFALDKETGDLIWSASVGTIGKSSPVIYNNTVFVVSENSIAELERTKVTAFRLDNGTVIWEEIIGIPMSLERVLSGYPYTTMADSTPAVYDEKLYVACPGGNVYALYTRNGTEAWSQNVYLKSLLGTDILDSSPAIADGKIYISTPGGELYSLDIANDGDPKSLMQTYPEEDGIPYVTSPIVSNGLVFVVAGEGSGTIGNHWFYCIGSYEEPTEHINGHLISIPIELPTGKWWKSFSADFSIVDDSNDIVFSILGEDKKHIRTIKNGDPINSGEKALERTIRLRANLSADNISVNPELAYWSVTFDTDDRAPDFVEDSFTPNPGGWINIPKPTCTIDVWDNISGLNLGSAYYEIGYYENNTTLKTHKEPAKYTGVNGTNFTTLTADISALDFADNITKLDSITFEIKDYADNIGSITIDIKQDNTKPTSSVSDEHDGGEFSDDYVVINVTDYSDSDPSGDDAASGIASISLYYRYSNDGTSWTEDWKPFGGEVTSSPFRWNFTDVRGGGYYELYSIATDEAENVEDAPDSGDVSFTLDNEPPDMPDLSGQHWFKELPEISIEFSDDFMLDSIEYQPEFGEWTLIESNIDQASYDSEWTLAQEFWDDMNSGTEYILEFRIKDTLDNTRIIEDDDGYKIYKDESRPNVDLEIPTLETEWSFEDTFKITAFATDGNGSGIKTVELFYRYSEDGDFDDDWSSYGDGGLTSEPFEWEFTAAEGNGYYEFYVRAEDVAGNAAESEVFSTGINIFPIFSVIAMVILIIALILITIVIIIKCKKK